VVGEAYVPFPHASLGLENFDVAEVHGVSKRVKDFVVVPS
jgi:hypothetical protein